MKRATRWGEGILIGAVLALLVALSWMLWLDRQPRTVSAVPVHSVSREELELAATINVNAATAAELDELPGIGPVLAANIIEYRETHGPFECPEDLMEVYGIGPVKLEEMRPYLRLE